MLNKNRAARIILIFMLATAMVITAIPATAFAATNNGVEWWNFRNNEENNGVTDRETPASANETALKWGVKMVDGYTTSFTPPLIINGYLYSASTQYVIKMDKDTGEMVAKSDKLAGDVGYAMNPITYACDAGTGNIPMLFIPISNGRVQCVNAETMKSLWVSEKVGNLSKHNYGTVYQTYNQTLAPITYKNGYVYTGTWNTETTDGGYVGIRVNDEDTSSETEEKKAAWVFKPSETVHQKTGDTPRGFYWAGSYATDRYVVFGSDDGSDNTFADTGSSTYTDTAILYSADPKSGDIIDKITGLKGDIRTTVVCHNGYLYFATKGGSLYKVKINGDGTFDKGTLSHYDMAGGGMMTAAPVVYNGRIYIGVCGTKGQFNADGGHFFAVLNDDEKLNDGSLAYTVKIPGYPQAAALLSTYTEKTDGKVRVYFTYNAPPGGIYYFEDKAGQTSAETVNLYTPETEMRQYCISTLCVDKEGTLYFKNDSGYLMAVAKNRAYLTGISVKDESGKELDWDQDFATGVLKYDLMVPMGNKAVKIKLNVPDGQTATVAGKEYTAGSEMPVTLDENGKAVIPVVVKKADNGTDYTRTYTLNVKSKSDNAYLKGISVSDSNTAGSSTINYTPSFEKNTLAYTTDAYDQEKSFLNVWPVTDDSDAKVTVTPVTDAANDSDHYLNDDGTIEDCGRNGNHRFPVYFIKGRTSATVRITVTSPNGKVTKSYEMTVLRDKSVSGAGITVLSLSQKKLTLYTGTSDNTGKLTATYLGEDAGRQTDFEWYSSNSSVATVDHEGNVTAVSPGTANIWATCNGDQVHCEVTVVNPELKLSAYSATLYRCSGFDSVQLAATANGKALTTGVTWKVTQGSEYASVSSDGLVKAEKSGTAIVTAAYGGSNRTCTVRIQEPSFVLSASSIKVKKGGKYTLDIRERKPAGRISYSISNRRIADISSGGVITGKKPGTTYLTLKCNGISRTVKISVVKSLPVRMGRITGLKAVTSHKKVKLTWKIAGANVTMSGYQVYMSTRRSSGYRKAAQTRSRQCTVKKGLKKNRTCYFRVRGYKKAAGRYKYTGWKYIKVKVK